MYSPTIAKKLIPVLYHTAKDQGVPMTVLVNRLLTESLARENLPQAAQSAFSACVAPAEKTNAQADTELAA